MNYGDRVRPPCGAVGNSNEGWTDFWRFLGFAVLIAVAIYFAWRAGWLGKIAAAAAPVANPLNWV